MTQLNELSNWERDVVELLLESKSNNPRSASAKQSILDEEVKIRLEIRS